MSAVQSLAGLAANLAGTTELPAVGILYSVICSGGLGTKPKRASGKWNDATCRIYFTITFLKPDTQNDVKNTRLALLLLL